MATTSKTVVGAINELRSGLNNLYTLDWDNKQTVGNTFTPTKNGLLIASAGGGSGTYVQISSENLSLSVSFIQSIGNASANCIVTKNRQFEINTNGTVNIVNTFIPFK